MRTKTRPGAGPPDPANKSTNRHTCANPGVASSDPKGEVSTSTRNSLGVLAESHVERQTVWETGHVSDRVHTRQTTAAHAAQDRSQRKPPGTTPSQGAERVRRRASPAPLPQQGPAAGTMSTVLGRPPAAPRSCPVKPGTTDPGMEEGTTATGKLTRAPRATGPDEARRTNAGPRGTPERHAVGQNHRTRTGAKQQRPPGAAKPGSAHNTRRLPQTAVPQRPHTAPTACGKQALAARPKDRRSGVGERPTPDAPQPGKTPPPGRPRAASTAHKASSQLRDLGLVTGPHSDTARTHSQWVADPGCTPK